MEVKEALGVNQEDNRGKGEISEEGDGSAVSIHYHMHSKQQQIH